MRMLLVTRTSIVVHHKKRGVIDCVPSSPLFKVCPLKNLVIDCAHFTDRQKDVRP
jgi:hypothetical protein